MNIKKNFYIVLSVLLATAMLLPILPAGTIKAAEVTGLIPGLNPAVEPGNIPAATPAAIAVAAVEDTNTTLNLMEGPITVTNQYFVQKDTRGIVIGEGNITGELVLTGNQSSGWNVTLNGSDLPPIRYKNATSNGSITGTASGILNIIIEGNCNINNALFKDLNNISEVNVTGVEGNLYTGPGTSIQTMVGGSNLTGLNVNGINFKTNGYTIIISVNYNISVINCTAAGSDGIRISNSANKGNSYDAVIKDCTFAYLDIYFGTNVLIDNVKSYNRSSNYAANLQYTSNCTIIINNSDLKFYSFYMGGSIFQVTDSRIDTGSSYFNGGSVGTAYIKGSSWVSTNSSPVQMKSGTSLCFVDNSMLFTQYSPAYGCFYNTSSKTTFDPLDDAGNPLFLNKVKVPGASGSRVGVSIDERGTVHLWTDTDGYLHLYLPEGEHTVRVADAENIEYEKTFTAIHTRPSGTDSNIIGALEPVKEAAEIATPYPNADILYSFDNSSWNNAATDAAGYFKAVIPDEAIRIYIQLSGSEDVRHAIISDGEAGEFYDDIPVITEQSSRELTFIQGRPGTVYVISVPYTIGSTLKYQWYKDGERLAGKTSPLLNLPAVQASDAGTYTCVITESYNRAVTSNPVTVTVADSQQEEEGKLSILSQSSGKTLIRGYSAELYINAQPSISTGELTYRWYKDGEGIPGAMESKLTLSAAGLEDSGVYICRVYEGTDYIDSEPIPVTVENNPLEDELADLYNQAAYLAEQAEALTEHLNTANREKEGLQNIIYGLESQIVVYLNQITALQESITELEQQLEESEGDKESLNETIRYLNTQIITLNQQISYLEQEVAAAGEEKIILEGTIADLYDNITHLDIQITILEGKLTDREGENTELKNQVTELNYIISGLETLTGNLQRDMEILNSSNISLQGQLDEANHAIAYLNTLLVLVKGVLGVSGHDEVIPAIQQLKAQLRQKEYDNILLQEQLDELTAELISAGNNNSDLTDKLQELMDLVGSEDADGIKDRITGLKTVLEESKARINELEQERSKLLNSLEEAEELNRTMQQRIDKLLDLSDADTEELKRQILGLTDEINRMFQNNDKLQKSIDSLNLQVNELYTEKAVLESEIIRLETLLDTASNTVEELRQQLAEMAASNNGLTNENASLKEVIEKLKKQLKNKNDSGSNSGKSNSSHSSEARDWQDKEEQTLKEPEDTKTVVLPAEIIDEALIKESAYISVTGGKIIAKDGWEIAPSLESQWGKDIELAEAAGRSGKQENVEYFFYARKENKPEQVYTRTISVEKPAAIPEFSMDKLIYLGSEFNLKVANVSKDDKVSYKSADGSIARINKSGTITPVKPGKTQITGTVTKGGIPYRFTINVTVKEGDSRTLNLKARTIQSVSDNPVLMVYKLVKKDRTVKLDLKGYAENAAVSYISSDSSVAAVNKDGIIKGIKKGNTTITATLVQNNTVYTYIIKVRVDDGTEDDTMWDYLTAV